MYTSNSNHHRLVRSLFAILISFPAILVASCGSPALPPPGVKTGTVVIAFSPDLGSRSILPSLDMAVDHYDINGTGPRGATFDLAGLRGTSSEPITLLVGDWVFAVSAFNAAATLIGSGTVAVAVVLDQTTTAPVNVVPLDGTGALELQVGIPDGACTDPAVKGSLTPQEGGSAIAIDMTISADKRGASFSSYSLPDGYYALALKLMDGPIEKSTLVDMVRILKGQTTSGSIAFVYNSATGSVTFTLHVDMQAPIDLTFSGVQSSLVFGQSMTVTAAASRTVASWQWYLNGVALPGQTSTTVTLGSDLPVGQYRLDLLVRSGIVGSSSGLFFEVTN